MSSQLRKLANQKTTWKSLRPISMTLVIWSEYLEVLPPITVFSQKIPISLSRL
jgi:hypothetical protein